MNSPHLQDPQTDKVKNSTTMMLSENLMDTSSRFTVMVDSNYSAVNWVDESAPRNTTGVEFLAWLNSHGLTQQVKPLTAFRDGWERLTLDSVLTKQRNGTCSVVMK